MKNHWVIRVVAAAFAGLLVFQAWGAAPAEQTKKEDPIPDEIRSKGKEAIDRGLRYLRSQQDKDGSWRHHTGITALALKAFASSPRKYREKDGPWMRKPVEFILAAQQKSGGIYTRELPNYNTAVAVWALASLENPKYKPVLDKAQKFLLGLQLDESQGYEPGKDIMYGGAGYGGDERPDMSNSSFWAAAMKATDLPEDDPAWKKMVEFVSKCQQSSATNPLKKMDVKLEHPIGNDGGALYYPDYSSVGTVKLPDGRVVWRSYGSMTYAMIMSFLYARVDPKDPRVVAAVDWVKKNYTLDENPGAGAQGLYYYYYTFAKAMRAYGEPTITDAAGATHNWRVDLIEKLASLQREDGSWVNTNKRWWENDPVLCTAYAVLALNEALVEPEKTAPEPGAR